MHFNLTPIRSEQVTPEIQALFDISKPTMPRAFNVLEGITRGQILVDHPGQPTRALVRDGMYGTLYFGGTFDRAGVDSLVQHFRGQGEVGIGCWPDDPLNDLLPPDFDYDGRTYYFTERVSDDRLANLQLPDGYSVIKRDEHLFLQSFDYQSTLELFGSLEMVMRHTLGVVIRDGDTVVCEAATGAPTHGWIEVGVTTAEAYRSKGLATIACTRLIQMCEEQGLRTWWDCAKQNIPSVKVANKLGYQGEPEYRYVWWAKF